MSKIYSQNDPIWKNQLLGKNTDAYYSIGNFGCLITSLCNACHILGVTDFYLGNYNKRLELNPSWLDDDLTNNSNGYADFGNYIWGSLDRAVEQGIKELGFLFNQQYRFNEFKNEIKSKIETGKFCALVQIDSIPDTSTNDQHWVLINSIDGDNVTIIDSWDGTIKPISDYYGATVYSANDTIFACKFITREINYELTTQNNNMTDQLFNATNTAINELQKVHPTYYDNWGRAFGNTDMAKQGKEALVWIREMCDQLSWKFAGYEDTLSEKTTLINSQKQELKELNDKYVNLTLENARIKEKQPIIQIEPKTQEKFAFDWNKQYETFVKSGMAKYVLGFAILALQNLAKTQFGLDIPLQEFGGIASIFGITGLTDTITYISTKIKK